jgi:uncharacterized membrane protein YeaQ/YmgE (transglycosylase-associated protein family)
MVIWIIIGAITGILMDSIMGGTGIGIGGAILVGVVGAVTGAWLFSLLEIKILTGMLGVILQASVGAVIFLVFVRITRRT